MITGDLKSQIDKVWFYDMQADGLSLDDKRSRTDKSFMVPVKEIQDNKYDLSINRYKEVVYEEKSYEKPLVIIGQIETLDKERTALLNQLKQMLS